MSVRRAITFRHLRQRFEALHLPTIAKGTKRRYRLDIDRRIRPTFDDRPLQRIAQLEVESFRAELVRELSPKSVNNCISLLALMFRKAVEWGMLDKSPVTIRNLKLPEVTYSWWESRTYVTSFLAAARRTEYYAAYLLALECGLRLGEIVGLSKKDVDLKKCRIHIHRQWLEAEGCLGPTKGGRQRFVNFSRDSHLKRALAEAMLKSPDKEAIFVTSTGRRIRATKLRTKIFHRLIRESDVPRIRFHDLRHTFASWYMLEHDDIWGLKRVLGHRDIKTTQRYAHLSKRAVKTKSLNWAVNR